MINPESGSSLKKQNVDKMPRREFLKALSRGAIVLGLWRLGLLGPREVVGDINQPMERNSEETKREWQRIKKDLEELVKQYEQQKTTLSMEDIQQTLQNCGFIDVKQVILSELKVSQPWRPFEDRDPLKESLESGIARGELDFSSDKLTFIQVPFEKIGAFCSAFFQHTYRTIFIDQEVPQAKKEALEKFICKQLIGCEYGRQYNLIYDNDALSEVEKARQVESLRAWLEATDKDSSLRDIKETLHETGDSCSQTVLELFILHEQELKKRINEYRFSKALNFVITKTNIPHEAFHDFYENQLTRPGYDGPTIEKLLAMALRGKRQRFGTKDPSYASIEEYLKGVKIDDEEVLSSFCKKITSQYDIVSTPKLYLNEEWRQFSDAQKWDYWTQRGLFVFLNEYLARVYNSALGNTPDQVLAELQKISAEFKREPPNFKLEEMYHKPFEEELKMLREMKWKGKSIIAN